MAALGLCALLSHARALSAAELSIVVQVQTREREGRAFAGGEGTAKERSLRGGLHCNAGAKEVGGSQGERRQRARGTHHKRDFSLVEEEMVHVVLSSQISE